MRYPSALRWAVRASAEMSRQSIFDPCSRPLGTGSRATSTWTWDCGMCETGRRRDGAGCAEGCDARARAIGRDAHACGACVETALQTASKGVQAHAGHRIDEWSYCMWVGPGWKHESRPKSASPLLESLHYFSASVGYTSSNETTARNN